MCASRATIAEIRFGYGRAPGQPRPDGPEALLAQLDGPGRNEPDISGPSARDRSRRFMDYIRTRKARRSDLTLSGRVMELGREIHDQFLADAAARIRAPIVSERGFYERLAWFWADHFTVAGKNNLMKTLAARFEAEAIRPHIAGNFRDMLKAASTHPAMIGFLDQFQSVGPESRVGRRKDRGLNENLAREIIELHTLGVGAPYSQADVRQFAELLTGLSIRRGTGETEFRAEFAEPGVEEVLGRTYGDDDPGLDDIMPALDDLAGHPATARHIARKLAIHFVSDRPSADLIAHIEAAFIRGQGDLRAVYAAMLDHPESWSRFGEKVKQPFDYIVSSIRAAGLRPKERAKFFAPKGRFAPRIALQKLNQPIYEAAGPDGWPEAAEVWITAQGMTERLNWAARMGRLLAPTTDPRAFLDQSLGEIASADTRFAVTAAAEKWEGVALVLGSPEFNRR